MKPGKDLILLTASLVLPLGHGTQQPLESKYVLTPSELAIIATRTTEINTFIKKIASDRGLAVFDSYTVLQQVKAGSYNFDGIAVTADFITGGVFSLDGIHPTPRGYALIADEMIKAINAKYGTSLSPVNGGDYVGVSLPK